MEDAMSNTNNDKCYRRQEVEAGEHSKHWSFVRQGDRGAGAQAVTRSVPSGSLDR